MTPEAALEAQIDRYRAMTREERVGIALRLHELACEMARVGIRRQHPKATPQHQASNAWGIPRTTHDLDFVLQLPPSQISAFVRAFDPPDYFVDETEANLAS